MFSKIKPTQMERAMQLPGDDIVPNANVSMDRAFTLNAKPINVWPWFLQLGKNRAGWYFPEHIEKFVPRKRRGLRRIEPALQIQSIGKRIDDWGGKKGYLEVVELIPPATIVYKSSRGKNNMSWAITLWPIHDKTRVVIRLRLSSSGGKLFYALGDFFDGLTILGLAAGLRERIKRQV